VRARWDCFADCTLYNVFAVYITKLAGSDSSFRMLCTMHNVCTICITVSTSYHCLSVLLWTLINLTAVRCRNTFFVTHENFQGMNKKEETEMFRETKVCFLGKMTRRESQMMVVKNIFESTDCKICTVHTVTCLRLCNVHCAKYVWETFWVFCEISHQLTLAAYIWAYSKYVRANEHCLEGQSLPKYYSW